MGTAVVVGTVIGSGIFKKPQVVAQSVPFFGMAALVWVLGGLLALLGALTLAEVAVLYPRAGGNYVFLREAYGRLAGFLWGWVEFWIIRGASLAALATIFTESFHDMLKEFAGPAADRLGYWPQKGLTVAVIMGLALVNVRGVRWGGFLQTFITLIKVGSLLGILALPFVVAALVGPSSDIPRPRSENLTPIWPTRAELSFGGFGTALLSVLWAYHGWMNIAPVAEEVRDPQRNIPLSLLAGVGIVVFLYLGANLAYYLIIPQPEMALMKAADPDQPVQDTPLGRGLETTPQRGAPAGVARSGERATTGGAETPDKTVAIGFCRRLLGSLGVGVAAAVVMCSVFGALNGNLLVGPRLLYALGEDGLAPPALGAVHPRYRTPALAILVMGGWASLLVLAVATLTRMGKLSEAKPHFDTLTDFAMFGAVIFETAAVATIFVFRRRLPDANRPYRCWGYPIVPLLYLILPALILTNMFQHQPVEAGVGVGFIALGVVAYLLIERLGIWSAPQR
jgi:amino acid transporter